MPGAGKLEVLLVGAKGLKNADVIGKMDPYVILTCRTQEQRSSVATGQGSEPRWNESFIFTITDDDNTDLRLKLMDSDVVADDFVGEATIPLHPVFAEGSLPSTPYNVVKHDKFCGEIRLSLTYTPDYDGRTRHHGNRNRNHHANEDGLTRRHGGHQAEDNSGHRHGDHQAEDNSGRTRRHGGHQAEEESFGGWKESSHGY